MAPGETKHSWGGLGTLNPSFYDLLASHLPTAKTQALPSLTPQDFLPPQGIEGQQGHWFRALGPSCPEAGLWLRVEKRCRRAARTVRPPHTPRNWQDTSQCGHSAAGPGTSPARPPRSSSAAPPLGESGLVIASCPSPAPFLQLSQGRRGAGSNPENPARGRDLAQAEGGPSQQATPPQTLKAAIRPQLEVLRGRHSDSCRLDPEQP